jgi:oligo-1,6-glucosidase
MVNIRLNNIEDYNDVDTRNKYEGLKEIGGDLNAFFRIKSKLRENGRTQCNGIKKKMQDFQAVNLG